MYIVNFQQRPHSKDAIPTTIFKQNYFLQQSRRDVKGLCWWYFESNNTYKDEKRWKGTRGLEDGAGVAAGSAGSGSRTGYARRRHRSPAASNIITIS